MKILKALLPSTANRKFVDYKINELLKLLMNNNLKFLIVNYNPKRKDLEEKDQRQDERNVIL